MLCTARLGELRHVTWSDFIGPWHGLRGFNIPSLLPNIVVDPQLSSVTLFTFGQSKLSADLAGFAWLAYQYRGRKQADDQLIRRILWISLIIIFQSKVAWQMLSTPSCRVLRLYCCGYGGGSSTLPSVSRFLLVSSPFITGILLSNTIKSRCDWQGMLKCLFNHD